MGNGMECKKKKPCIKLGNHWNETLMDIKVRPIYYVNRKRRVRFGRGNRGQFITRESYR